MSADHPATSDGGTVDFPYPWASWRSRSQPAFRHMGHGAGHLAAARRFARPSTRNVDQLSSGVRRGRRRFPGPPSGGRSAIVLLPSRFPVPSSGRFVTFRRATAGYVDRLQAAMGSRHRPGTASRASRRFPAPLRPCRRSDSDHLGKRYILGRNQESRSRPGNCISTGNAISWELTSLNICCFSLSIQEVSGKVSGLLFSQIHVLRMQVHSNKIVP